MPAPIVSASPNPEPPATLPEAFARAASDAPQRGIAIFDGRGRSYERRTYPEVLAAARQAAGRWAALGVAPGDRVLVALPTSWGWLDAWLGALFTGALPVAVAPGAGLGGGEAQLQRLASLVERLAASRLVVAPGVRGEAERLGAAAVADVAITPEELAATTPARFSPPSPRCDDIAFLQLTSGSTGLPRAVMIPHRAALHNPWASDRAIGSPRGGAAHQWAESMVSWLPLHHDMGLVGCLFLSVLAGLDLWLLQPTAFLARPRQWLDQLGRHGRSFAPAPNFGYQLCVERLAVETRAGLDLASWSDAMTGAEMIRPETVAAFCEAFTPHGFRPEAFRPCYGLAEATLAVTFDLRGEGVRTRPLPAGAASSAAGFGLSAVVSVGEPITGTAVTIVDPAGRPLPDGEVGEVRVEGPGVFAGYWGDAEASATALRDGRLHTGDLGFVADGELYLTGRLKDVLILRGHNLMPHEIEWLAEGVTGGGGAIRSGAFSVARGAEGEQAVLVVEVGERDRLAELARDIRRAVGRTLSLPLADLVFVRRGRIPKTTSGKVQRRALREQYLRGELERWADGG